MEIRFLRIVSDFVTTQASSVIAKLGERIKNSFNQVFARSNLEGQLKTSDSKLEEQMELNPNRNEILSAMVGATKKGFVGALKTLARMVGLQGHKIKQFKGKEMVHAEKLASGQKLNPAGFYPVDGLKIREKENFKVMADYIYDGAILGADPDKKINRMGGTHGVAYSAKTPLSDVRGVVPEQGVPNGKCLYINGMNTPASSHVKSMQHIANQTGMEVIGIHNSTNGFNADVIECLGDKLNLKFCKFKNSKIC